jgi:hypothetical protein
MNGLLYVAFGSKFEIMAAKTIAYSQRFTDLPITVLTNIADRCPGWSKTKNINFVYINDSTGRNRNYKTSMINYSPYEKTIYMDVDSVIQKKGIEKAFDLLDGNDIMLNVYGKWVGRVPLSYYRKVMAKLAVTIPIMIYYGAFVGFTKTEKAKSFFKTWNANWKKSGIKREMPALACTVKKMDGLKLVKTGNKSGVFTWMIRDNFIIQHEYGARFWRKFFPEG